MSSIKELRKATIKALKVAYPSQKNSFNALSKITVIPRVIKFGESATEVFENEDIDTFDFESGVQDKVWRIESVEETKFTGNYRAKIVAIGGKGTFMSTKSLTLHFNFKWSEDCGYTMPTTGMLVYNISEEDSDYDKIVDKINSDLDEDGDLKAMHIPIKEYPITLIESNYSVDGVKEEEDTFEGERMIFKSFKIS